MIERLFGRIKAFLYHEDDPVHYCDVYLNKAQGSCAHVDGYLCNMKTCSILHEYRQDIHNVIPILFVK